MSLLKPFVIAGFAAILFTGTAFANQNNTGQGGGYHGGAKFTDNSFLGVGPYPSFSACDTALKNAIIYAVSNQGKVLWLEGPCHYRSGFTIGGVEDTHWHVTDFVVPIGGNTPEESLEMMYVIDEEIRRLRDEYGIDGYDAALKAIEEAATGAP